MSASDSVSRWLGILTSGRSTKAEQGDAEEGIVGRYFKALVEKATMKLRGSPPLIADEEDVALSAFRSFFRRIDEGRFSPNDGEGLWKILMTLVCDKIWKLRRYENQDIRDRNRTVTETQSGGESSEYNNGLASVIGDEPTPEMAALARDELAWIIKQLDGNDQSLLTRKMDGFTNKELAKQMDVTERTICRKLKGIREIWIKRLHDEQGV
jgi:DNA-directed RNA polymerase specialized sigma24 family protein